VNRKEICENKKVICEKPTGSKTLSSLKKKFFGFFFSLSTSFWTRKHSADDLGGHTRSKNSSGQERLLRRLLVLLLFGALTPSNGALRLALWRPQSALAGEQCGRGCIQTAAFRQRLFFEKRPPDAPMSVLYSSAHLFGDIIRRRPSETTAAK